MGRCWKIRPHYPLLTSLTNYYIHIHARFTTNHIALGKLNGNPTALKQIGLFDERFFLYAEDTDLSRRIHQKFETLYFPWAEIFHVHERGSYKNFGLTLHNLKSAAQYFNKWGWFFDRERTIINQRAALNSYSLMASDNTLENVGMG